MRKLVASSVALVLLLTFCSCDYNIYEISMKTNGDVLERTVTVYRVQDSNAQPASGTSQTTTTPVSGTSQERATPTTSRAQLPKDQLDAIQKIYGNPVSSDADGTRTFAGRFTGRTPQDVGGSGHYVQYQSDMGCAKVYTERFRGTDDVAALVEKICASADSVTDGLKGWFKTEIKDDPRVDKLVAFMDGPFRHDLKSLGLYAFIPTTSQPVASPASQPAPSYTEVAVRALQYLADREYFKPADLPQIVRTLEHASPENPQPFMAVVQRMVADRMGVGPDEPMPKSLAFLADTQRAGDSFESYLRTTPEYKRILKEWESKRTTTSPADTPPPPTEALHMYGLIDQEDFGGDEDHIRISLATSIRPFQTNGGYDAALGQVRWEFAVRPAEKDRYPAFCYAVWAEPNVAAQKAHFGRVLLEGEVLSGYCIWYKSLTPDELTRWQDITGVLKPGPDLRDRLAEFLLHPERRPVTTATSTPATQPTDYVDKGIDIISHALDAQTRSAK